MGWHFKDSGLWRDDLEEEALKTLLIEVAKDFNIEELSEREAIAKYLDQYWQIKEHLKREGK